MDYLRTLGSAAVSTLVQKSGLNLPFNLGQKVCSFDNVCVLYDATKRDDGTPVSVFEYDFADPTRKSFKAFAQNALRKLRTTRHPDVLKFLDVVEADSTLHIMTEHVKPLQSTLPSWSSRSSREREDWLLWGLHRISVALTFLNDACNSTHGRVCIDSIFIGSSGEWKLGGFDLLSAPKDEAGVLYTMGNLYPGTSAYAPPEVRSQGWVTIKDSDPAAADGYALGVLLHTVFNSPDTPLPTLSPPHPPPSASSRGSIPFALFNSFKRLLNPNPKNRLTPKKFLELGMSDSGFFQSNNLVKICLGLDNFVISNEAEKSSFLRILKDTTSSFPSEFTSFRVLPSLTSALEFGGAMAASILPLVIQLGTTISPEEYNRMVVGPLVKLYTSPDRGTRMALLDHLSEYADKLDKKTVSDKIWPHLHTGFSDTVAVIREATTKSIIHFAPKLNDRILNNDLLRLLAKMQADQEASIRTNTCILIGRLGPSLGYNTKRKVLVPAFARALKDSFVHARVAALLAFMATIDCFEIEDIATKVIPNVSPSLIDKEKLVRDQAFKTIDLFLKRLESHSATMPEIATTETSDASSGSLPASSNLMNTAAGAAGALAGWAITSLGKRLAASDLQSTITPQAGVALKSPSNADTAHTEQLAFGAALTNIPGAFQPSDRAMGMQLGSKQKNPELSRIELDFEEESRSPWGNDDLIDINADQDDWGAFETALSTNSPLPKPAPTLGGTSIFLTTSPDSQSSGGKGQVPSRKSGNLAPLQKVIPTSKATTSSSIVSSRPTTPLLSPQPNKNEWDDGPGWDDDTERRANDISSSAVPSLAGLSKDEKAAELARRKEERKHRIAQLKEQKRNIART